MAQPGRTCEMVYEQFIQFVEVTDVSHTFLIPHEIPDEFMLGLCDARRIGINPQYPDGKGEILQPAMKWMTDDQMAILRDFISYTEELSYTSLQ